MKILKNLRYVVLTPSGKSPASVSGGGKDLPVSAETQAAQAPSEMPSGNEVMSKQRKADWEYPF